MAELEKVWTIESLIARETQAQRDTESQSCCDKGDAECSTVLYSNAMWDAC